MPEPIRLMISCEHGGNRVPTEYRALFRGHEELLATHRGYDIGILPLARRLAAALDAPVETAEVTRLLVDLNRSRHTPALFSGISRILDRPAREKVLARYYYPYRQRVAERVGALLAQGGLVAHLSIHSFTPEMDGTIRNADLGLLYDPVRPREAEFCRLWQQFLIEAGPEFRVRRNYPYRGVSDALVTHLRRRLPARSYLGMELEVNQKHPTGDPQRWERLQQVVVQSLRHLVNPQAKTTGSVS